MITKKFIANFIIFLLFIIFTGCTSFKSSRSEYLSKHFTAQEAFGNNINNVSDEIYENAKYTAKRMEKIRSFLGQPLNVVSWYRTPSQNKESGGAQNSAHMKGLAVDFRLSNTADQRLIFNKLIKSNLSYDVIIFYRNHNMIHIGFKKDRSEEIQLIMTREYQ